MGQDPSPRRLVLRAAFLVLPLLLFAVIYPLVRRPSGAGGAPGEAAAVARQAEAAAAAQARRADEALGGSGGVAGKGGEPPPRRDGPTAAETQASRSAEEALARLQRKGLEKAEFLAPREAQAGPDGELTAPFHGFGLSVESVPAGASVRVGGQLAGETPLVTSVACQPGDRVEVRVEKRPLPPASRTVRCRADTLLTVQVRLGR